MPRPKTKQELLDAMQKEHQALQNQLDVLTPLQMLDLSAGWWSVKDILTHLSEWEQMCLGWYRMGKEGKKPAVPAEGYNWAQLPALNQQILEKYRKRPLEETLDWFENSYREILETVKALPQEDLFTPGRFEWTGNNLLAAYFIGSTSSHYLWARKEIRKRIKQ